MGAFLGRRGQSKSLNTVQSIHTKMLQWRHELPKELQLASYAAQDEQSSLLQLQALNLQLTYDNLQIILHRTAAFENDGQLNELRMTGGGSTSLQQLLDSAMDTSELYRYSSALQASGRTHAAMHIGITLFTAGVVLCAIRLSRPLTDIGNRAKTGVMHIIRMCRSAADSPTSSQHLISRQSLDILDSLVTVVLRQETELITARVGLVPNRPTSFASTVGTASATAPVISNQHLIPDRSGGSLHPIQEGETKSSAADALVLIVVKSLRSIFPDQRAVLPRLSPSCNSSVFRRGRQFSVVQPSRSPRLIGMATFQSWWIRGLLMRVKYGYGQIILATRRLLLRIIDRRTQVRTDIFVS